MAVYLQTAPEAARRTIASALRTGVRDRNFEREGNRLAAIADTAGAPRWVRKHLRNSVDPQTAVGGLWAARMWMKGWAEEDHDAAKDAGLLHGPQGRWWQGVTAWDIPRKHDGHSDPRADDPPPGWWEERCTAREACRTRLGVFLRLDEPGPAVAKPLGCGERSCPTCSRLAQWRAVSRYTVALAAPLRKGWKREFYTVGSTETITTPAELAEWRRGLGAVIRGMVEGRESMGIPEGSWAGGLCVVETVPRDGGGVYAHAHLLIIAREWYPWGWSKDRLNKAFDRAGVYRRWTETGRPRADALRQAGLGREVMGLRELQRRHGVGEVGKHERVREKRDASGVEVIARYLAKVQAYMSKIEARGEGAKFWDDPRIQWTMKGVRRCQPFGDLLGTHAGPTKRGWETYPGWTDHRAYIGDAEKPIELHGPTIIDEHFAGGVLRPLPDWITTVEPCDRFETHTLNTERIKSWRWCHQPRFWDWLRKEGRRRPRIDRPWKPEPIPLFGVKPLPDRRVVDLGNGGVRIDFPAARSRAREALQRPPNRRARRVRRPAARPSDQVDAFIPAAVQDTMESEWRRRYGKRPKRRKLPVGNCSVTKPDSAKRQVESDRGTRTRTRDLLIWNQLLYQLSYTPSAACVTPSATPRTPSAALLGSSVRAQ